MIKVKKEEITFERFYPFIFGFVIALIVTVFFSYVEFYLIIKPLYSPILAVLAIFVGFLFTGLSVLSASKDLKVMKDLSRLNMLRYVREYFSVAFITSLLLIFIALLGIVIRSPDSVFFKNIIAAVFIVIFAVLILSLHRLYLILSRIILTG